ncbi:MAG: YggS family pyridoxal phosphate-dependent enzyme [Pseudomonadales bacterium]|nr:YggS family pyridoxal phosphate-dependent enzyme [Pseudomonadales bacterium]
MIDIATNIAALKSRIQQASTKYSRDAGELVLVAVSKKQPASAIAAAHAAGQRHFGENYVQEAIAKIDQMQQTSLIWHFIGPIQSNKTQAIAEHFDWVHSVDRLKIAQRLAAQRPPGHAALNICLQVNIDADPAKAGVAVNDCIDLAQHVANLPGLALRGLMAIPARTDAPAQTRDSFRRLRELQQSVACQLPAGAPFDQLSMGMSDDFELAIAEGATLLRVGTAIFGARSP